MLLNEDIVFDDVIVNDIYEIEAIMIKKKYNIEPIEVGHFKASKYNLRGYLLTFEFEVIIGTKLVRMFTKTNHAEKEFNKLKNLLDKR